MRVLGEFGAPDIGQQLPMGHHPARASHQTRQQLEFSGRQVQGFAATLHHMRRQINTQIFQLMHRHGRGKRRTAVPQGNPDACQQLANAEWLGQVIIRPRIEQRDLLRLLMAGGHHNDGNRLVLAHFAHQLHAIPIGKPQIENNDIGRVVAQECAGLTQRHRGLDVKTLDGQG